jgi:hypothetical protein
MTITRAELAASLATLDPHARFATNQTATFRIGAHVATIRFEELPPRRLGGLVVLPQARVTLDLTTVPESDRARFLRSFDIAFQRGGG